jgi:predicted metal-dependent phosphoesterase TrpH
MTIDLHNHSYYSDGVLSPSEVVCLAKESGCNVFALGSGFAKTLMVL